MALEQSSPSPFQNAPHRPESALLLQFDSEIGMEVSIVWFLSMDWKMIWDARSDGKKSDLYKIKSEMEARIALLRTRRLYVNDIILILRCNDCRRCVA